MVKSILILVEEGFDDMAYLSCQVILEECGNDVIVTSVNGGTVRGQDSSALTSSFQDAISSDMTFDALVLIGGNTGFANSTLPAAQVDKFTQSNLPLGLIGSAIPNFSAAVPGKSISNDSSIVKDGVLMTMFDPKEAESFAEQFCELVK